MAKRVHYHPNLIFSVGTQVVTLKDVIGQNGRIQHPRGAVGVVIKTPRDQDHSYRLHFPDGVEASLKQRDIVMLAQYQEGEIGDSRITSGSSNLYERVIFRCIIGSRAYGQRWSFMDTHQSRKRNG